MDRPVETRMSAPDDVEATLSELRAEIPRPMRVLLLCNYDLANAPTVCDHVNAIVNYSNHHVYPVSGLGDLLASIDLSYFDAILVHYSLTLAIEWYVSPHTRAKLKEFAGLKAIFIQDEYRFVEKTSKYIAECGFHVVFTCLKPADVSRVYPSDVLSRVRFEQTLTGYLPSWLTIYPTVPLERRRFDVGYRGRVYPAWHGRSGLEKVEIGARFLKDARKYDLKCNIKWREGDRLYGSQWVAFIQSCRAMLAVESGASVFDMSGRIGVRTELYSQLMNLDSKEYHSDIKLLRSRYERLREQFFHGSEDLIDLSQVSPRVFEAVALRTLLIMYEGRYSDVLEPWVHYVPLKKDHSNMEEVARVVKNVDKCAEMITNAYDYVLAREDLSYGHFVARLDNVVAEEVNSLMRAPIREFSETAALGGRGLRLTQNPYAVNTRVTQVQRAVRRARRLAGRLLRIGRGL